MAFGSSGKDYRENKTENIEEGELPAYQHIVDDARSFRRDEADGKKYQQEQNDGCSIGMIPEL